MVGPSVSWSVHPSVSNHFFKTENLAESSCVIIPEGEERGGEGEEMEEEEADASLFIPNLFFSQSLLYFLGFITGLFVEVLSNHSFA